MKYQPIKYKYTDLSKNEIIKRSNDFYKIIKKRRSIRDFGEKSIPNEIIKKAILSAGSAPSGANLQPWHFVVVKNKNIKKKIRIAAEREEINFYKNKAPVEWLNALKPLGTNSEKKFIENAALLIAIFEKKFSKTKNKKIKNYYVKESVGIATGFLISFLHYAGLSMLTHTPSPMNFLNKILNRPKDERAFLLLIVGHPSKDCRIPKYATKKKKINQISTWY